MNKNYIEVKTTEGQILFLRKDQVEAFEIVPASARVEGHVKVYVGGFKFLVNIGKDEFLKLLEGN